MSGEIEKSIPVMIDEKAIAEIIEELACEIMTFFNEEFRIYYDVLTSTQICLEIHFSDCNFYERTIDINESKNQIVMSILEFVKKERMMDKIYPTINRNNVRYFQEV